MHCIYTQKELGFYWNKHCFNYEDLQFEDQSTESHETQSWLVFLLIKEQTLLSTTWERAEVIFYYLNKTDHTAME